jgi:hypothetical protein
MVLIAKGLLHEAERSPSTARERSEAGRLHGGVRCSKRKAADLLTLYKPFISDSVGSPKCLRNVINILYPLLG